MLRQNARARYPLLYTNGVQTCRKTAYVYTPFVYTATIGSSFLLSVLLVLGSWFLVELISFCSTNSDFTGFLH